jgi:hypothetical protein
MRLALIAVLGTLVACGDDGITIATNQDNFCEQMADVACHNAYQCCTEGEIESILNVSEPRTEQQCREDFRRNCERELPSVRDSLKAGRVTFDPAKLDACLEAIVAPEGVCSQVLTTTTYPWTEVCASKNAPWVGTVPTDGQCFYAFDCVGAPDSFCGPDQKCHAKPTAGFPCSNGTCASAYYCATNNTCAQKVAAGGPCSLSQPGMCDTDLFCDNKGTTVTTDDVCAARQPGGATCNGPQGCLSNGCVAGQCSGAFGGVCYSDLGCQSTCAVTGNACAVSGDCGNGTCSLNSSISCHDDTVCANGGYGVCGLYPRSCLPGDCVGDGIGICTSSLRTADYCDNIGNLPTP